MNKRARTSGPEARTTMVASAVLKLSVDYEQSQELPIGKAVYSDTVSVSQDNLWRVECFLRGEKVADGGKYISVFLRHMGESTSVMPVFEVCLMDRSGRPSMRQRKTTLRDCETMADDGNGRTWGWTQFIAATLAERNYTTADGHITFVCSIMVIDDSSTPVPPSDIGAHLGQLLDHAEGTDVSFIVEGQMFHAHRAVLAARSSVFRAELFGSMSEATMPSITLQDIAPATFEVMLRLKIICAHKLWEEVSIETATTILACAETYNCAELKSKCIDFIVLGKNLKEVIFTESYGSLLVKFPSVAAELRERLHDRIYAYGNGIGATED
ncbi:BTB/POZ and MATH domain-containing protein 2-like isoform X2 [Triticum dicoccoides]|uniref:BTB/POZ and MATH domain-containing protein 2-like isoform X2 n=1 Tax=Triticum dicoccoides TaxID=85692 RepID=UPI00188ECCCB|nr:BTB/POZ and MATH domain-containing protein 2-like isoform X2 [Triticum dicoccoides]